MLAHYATPRWRGEPISTGFVENGVNEILAKRMNWMQQTRKARPLHPYLRAQLPDRLIASTQHNFVTQDPLTVDPLDHASARLDLPATVKAHSRKSVGHCSRSPLDRRVSRLRLCRQAKT
jgi:hypothetical protein